jgi:hypothetical protein
MAPELQPLTRKARDDVRYGRFRFEDAVSRAHTYLQIAGMSAAVAALATVGLTFGLPRYSRSILNTTGDSALQQTAAPTLSAQPDLPHDWPDSIGSGIQTRSTLLVLPEASNAFIGYWGGYVHSRIHSIVPGYLTGENPSRVSVMFGRSGDAIFVASELYSSPRQHILSRPRARMVSPQEALITYTSEDRQLVYKCSHTFLLRNNGEIQYRSRIDVYSRPGRTLVGTVTQRASLRRLLTIKQRRAFARPSPSQIPRSSIAAVQDFSPSRSAARPTFELPSHPVEPSAAR